MYSLPISINVCPHVFFLTTTVRQDPDIIEEARQNLTTPPKKTRPKRIGHAVLNDIFTNGAKLRNGLWTGNFNLIQLIQFLQMNKSTCFIK